MTTIDITTPATWTARSFWLSRNGRAFGVILAFAPTSFSVGIEFMATDCKGIAFMFGPVWIGFATLAAPPPATPTKGLTSE